MKNLKNVIPIAVALIAIALSCKKSNNETAANFATIDAPKVNGIAKNEPVVFNFTNNTSNIATSWSVAPNSNVNIVTNGNTATIKFGNAGSYTVTARAGNVIANTNVTVDSTNVPNCGVIAFPANDSISITPSVIDSAGIKKLKVVIQGSTFYPNGCYSLASNINGTIDNQIYNLQVTGVNKPCDSINCIQVLLRARNEHLLSFNTNGVAVFSVKLNSTLKYEGTIKRDTIGGVPSSVRFTFTRTGTAAGANVFPTVVQ